MAFLMRGEFEFIRDIKKKFTLEYVGDDCAVLPLDHETDLLVTADLLVEDVDFRLSWAEPESLGHKALAVSLSDIAAMGGRPRHALMSIGAPKGIWQSEFLDRLYAGWHELARRYGVELVGGDVSRTTDALVIDSMVMGTVPKGTAIRRSGASPGEGVFVTGPLGAAAGGLRLLDQRTVTDVGSLCPLERRQLFPEPRIDAGVCLLEKRIATSMIDISDGLSSDLHQLCAASGVGARINASAIPVSDGLRDHFGDDTAFDLALNGGEDFELLFTAPREKIARFPNERVHEIGVVTEIVKKVELNNGKRMVELAPKGYSHF